jgi:intraflagellar transport protein 172
LAGCLSQSRAFAKMQLRHLQSIMPATNGIKQVTAMAWTPNRRNDASAVVRLAVVSVDQIVHLFDESGERKDRFATKPAVKGNKNFLVRALVFSPDCTKLAVGQTDNICIVYKVGRRWGDKKTVVNKFPQQNEVTAMCWPTETPQKLIFCTSDGAVKIGNCKTHKTAVLFQPTEPNYCVAVCASADGQTVVSAHIDGTIFRMTIESGASTAAVQKIAQHTCPAYALDFGRCIIAGGGDQKVHLYNPETCEKICDFDYTEDEKVQDMTVARFAPGGTTCVVGNWNCFFIYAYDNKSESWREISRKEVPNLHSVTALSWKSDGSKLAIGATCGVCDLYDACLRRYRYRGSFEFTYISPSQVIVKRLSNNERCIIKSNYDDVEITRINIFQNRFLVANTSKTLLMGDLDKSLISEIQWVSNGSEKFFFDNESACMAYNVGELTIVQYGSNEVLGSCRTEHMSPHLISLRINEQPYRPSNYDGSATPGFGGQEPDNKKVAYLLDIQTIRIVDLAYGTSVAQITHDAKIDFLELNTGANLILFRDKRHRLHIYDIDLQKRNTLLPFCNYAQWVPEADVIVAQNRKTLSVWYNPTTPDKMTTIEINGDIEEIERLNGHTTVIVDEGLQQSRYELKEGLIMFGNAINVDLTRAMDTLDPLALSKETEAMWRKLLERSLKQDQLNIAQRCAVALGDMPQARFLNDINKLVSALAAKEGSRQRALSHYTVRARLAMLRKKYKEAELIYVDQNQPDEAIDMYQMLHRWDLAIAVAEKVEHKDSAQMKSKYEEYLLHSHQEQKAAEIKIKDGDVLGGISLYVKGALPALAARVIRNHPNLDYSEELLEQVAAALTNAGMSSQAGGFYEKMGQSQRALEAYQKGNAWREAVALARKSFPEQVMQLEETWADFLVSQKQVDAAIAHYIEAGVVTKAIEAALEAKQWTKAISLIQDSLTADPETAKPYYKRIARHYQELDNYAEAEKFWIKAGLHRQAVEMYTSVNRWDEAHSVAMAYMNESDVGLLYITQAQRMEASGQLKMAEKLYLKVKEPDLAIQMYKKAQKYDQMIRLVGMYRKDLLKETHLHLAQQLEMEARFKEAEHHYTQAEEWMSAVNMYRANDQWDEAIRVAHLNGGKPASNRVAYAWAMSIGGEAGAKLLARLGLVEQAIDFNIERQNFDHAFDLARTCLTKKVPEVHLKKALYLEDEERFKEAEDEFVKAGKPKEAIDMWLHQEDWGEAMRVAESYEASSIPDVFVAQGNWAALKKDFKTAEKLFVNAKKPEKAMKMYTDAKMWQDAIRFTKTHLPHKSHHVNMLRQQDAAVGASGGGAGAAAGGDSEYLTAAQSWEEMADYNRAIDAYLNCKIEHVPGQDQEELLNVWLKASKLAQEHVKDRAAAVVTLVADRMKEGSRLSVAADLLSSIAKYREAIDLYIEANDWDKARELSRTKAADYQGMVDKKYDEYLVNVKKDGGELVNTGNWKAGVDMFVDRRQWDKVFEVLLEEHLTKKVIVPKPPILASYALKNAHYFVDHEDNKDTPKVLEAIAVLKTYGTESKSEHFDLYRLLSTHALSLPRQELAKLGTRPLVDARDFVYSLLAELSLQRNAAAAEFKKLFAAVHFTLLKEMAAKDGLKELEAMLAIALLKDGGPLAFDKAFCDAGDKCEKMGWTALAYAFYNRFIDIIEAIDEKDSSMLDNADFDGVLPTPCDMPMPPRGKHVGTEVEEEIREKVLAWAMDDTIEQENAVDLVTDKLRFHEAINQDLNKRLNKWVQKYEKGKLNEWNDPDSLQQLQRLMRMQ